jgi:hypothetical protein
MVGVTDAVDFTVIASPFVALLIVWLGFRAQLRATDLDRRQRAFANLLLAFSEFANLNRWMLDLHKEFEQLKLAISSGKPVPTDLIREVLSRSVVARVSSNLAMGPLERDPKKVINPKEALAVVIEALNELEARSRVASDNIERAKIEIEFANAGQGVQLEVLGIEKDLLEGRLNGTMPAEENVSLWLSKLRSHMKEDLGR